MVPVPVDRRNELVFVSTVMVTGCTVLVSPVLVLVRVSAVLVSIVLVNTGRPPKRIGSEMC